MDREQNIEEARGIVGNHGLNNVKIESENRKSRKKKDDSIFVHDETSHSFDLPPPSLAKVC